MKLDNYKNIKKTEWQVIANNFGIKYEENSVVRYLVEKIAEKIGVDDKIVSDNELKKYTVPVPMYFSIGCHEKAHGRSIVRNCIATGWLRVRTRFWYTSNFIPFH